MIWWNLSFSSRQTLAPSMTTTCPTAPPTLLTSTTRPRWRRRTWSSRHPTCSTRLRGRLAFNESFPRQWKKMVPVTGDLWSLFGVRYSSWWRWTATGVLSAPLCIRAALWPAWKANFRRSRSELDLWTMWWVSRSPSTSYKVITSRRKVAVWLYSKFVCNRTRNRTAAIYQMARVRNGSRKEDPGEVGVSELDSRLSITVHFLPCSVHCPLFHLHLLLLLSLVVGNNRCLHQPWFSAQKRASQVKQLCGAWLPLQANRGQKSLVHHCCLLFHLHDAEKESRLPF